MVRLSGTCQTDQRLWKAGWDIGAAHARRAEIGPDLQPILDLFEARHSAAMTLAPSLLGLTTTEAELLLCKRDVRLRPRLRFAIGDAPMSYVNGCVTARLVDDIVVRATAG